MKLVSSTKWAVLRMFRETSFYAPRLEYFNSLSNFSFNEIKVFCGELYKEEIFVCGNAFDFI